MLNELNISIPESWIDSNKSDYFTLSVKDESYEPYFLKGDILIICKDLCKCSSDDVFVYYINRELELRKVSQVVNSTVILEGITPYIPPLIDAGFKNLGFVYMRITNYRQGAANNGKNATY